MTSIKHHPIVTLSDRSRGPKALLAQVRALVTALLIAVLVVASGTTSTSTPLALALSSAPSPVHASSTIQSKLAAQIVDTQGAVTPIHDPAMIEEDGTYYVFSTGPGIPIHCSKDLVVWDFCGQVFGTYPDWIAKAIPDVEDLWAPDISFHAGRYHLYYAASTFGSTHSAIGLATTPTLDQSSPEYDWVDQGEVISTRSADNYNAIDPSLSVDKDGQPWLTFGSFWSGIKLVEVDRLTGKPEPGAQLVSLANNPGSDAVEGAFITRRGDFYYLFVSHDYCCQGVMSTYNIRVGRSRDITGPYVDQDGNPMMGGGGTLVYDGSDRWSGPGGSSIYVEGDTYYMVYHAYDANFGDVPTLRIEALMWDRDGWPVSPSASVGG